MATDYENLRIELHTVAPWVVPVISTFSAAGTTAYGVDTVLFSDPNGLGFSADGLNNMWLFRPDASTTDREKLIGGNSGAPLDLTNARIYPSVAWSDAPDSAEQYELWSLKPQTAFNILVARMRRFWVPTFGPLAGINDEDMEASGVTNFTTTSGNALTKVSTTGNTLTGKNSLFFNADNTNQYAESATYRVTPERSYGAGVSYRVAGGPGIFVIYDKTNSAEIESSNRVSHSQTDFMEAWRNFTTPSGCEEISLRVYGTGATDDIYIDHFHRPRSGSEGFLDLPTWVLSKRQVRRIMLARYRQAVEGDAGTVYDARSRVWERDLLQGHEYAIRANPHHANLSRVEFTDGFRLPLQEVWCEALRRAADVYTLAFTAAGETSPSLNLDQRLLAIDWAVGLAEYVVAGDPNDVNALTTLSQFTVKDEAGERRPVGEYKELLSDYEATLTTPHIPPQQAASSYTRF